MDDIYGFSDRLLSELSRNPYVLKGEFLGRLGSVGFGSVSPVVSQILTQPNPYEDALRKARIYKYSEFSDPTNVNAYSLRNYGGADYYSNNFGRYS